MARFALTFRFTGRLKILLLSLLLVPADVAVAQEASGDADKAIEIFTQGQDAHEKGELVKAIELYQNALRLLPEFPEAEFQRGSALLALNRIAESESAFRRAVELRGDWTLALTALGSVLTRQGKLQEAEKLLLKVAEMEPSNSAAIVALADLRLKTGAKEPHLSELLSKLRLFSTKAAPTPGVWIARAKIEASLGDLKAAASSIDAALELDPKNRDALFQKADLALRNKDVELASVVAGSLEASGAQADDLLILRTRIAFASGRDKDAEAFLAKIGRPTTESEKLRTELASARTTSPEELERQLGQNPEDAAILGRLCTLFRTANPERALQYCLAASKAEPGNIGHAVGYGAALVQARKYDDAILLLRRVVKAAPDNYTAHANLATALFQSKQYDAAKSEFRWLISKQPSIAVTYYFLAICHDQLGEHLDALANYSQFLKLADPEKNKLEIEKVNLRLPALEKQVKRFRGRRNAN